MNSVFTFSHMLSKVFLQMAHLIFFYFYFFFFFFGHAACGILVPQPGIKSTSPAMEQQSLTHWTAREVPYNLLIRHFFQCTYTDLFPYLFFGLPRCMGFSLVAISGGNSAAELGLLLVEHGLWGSWALIVAALGLSGFGP